MSRRSTRDAADFDGYVAARWPAQVRTAVLLGCPESRAADVTLDALARCRGQWGELRQVGDVDRAVAEEVVGAWDRFRQTADPAALATDGSRPAGPAAPRGPAGGPAGGMAGGLAGVDAALAAELDALGPAERARRVLDGGERLRAAVALLPVLSPPSTEEVDRRAREDRRRRTARGLRLTAAVVVPLALVVGGLTWAALRGGSGDTTADPVLPTLAVARATNPADVIWAAGGTLHLPRATVAVPAVRQLAPSGSGAIYADRADRVVALAADGTQTILGHEDPDLGFVSSDERGWAAWVDPTGSRPALMVVDVASRRVIGRLPVPRGDSYRPIAIDGDTVYFADDQGARGWQPAVERRPAYVVEPDVLVDVAGMTRLYQVSAVTLQAQEPLADAIIPMLGVGGRLNDDGTLLATRLTGEAGGTGDLAVYDTTTGDRLQDGVADDELVVDASFGPGLSVTYLVARKADRPGASDELRASFAGALQLRTCRLFLSPDVPPECRLDSDIPVSGVAPVLGH